MTIKPRNVTFRNGAIDLAGLLFVPPGDAGQTFPALVIDQAVDHPNAFFGEKLG